MVSCVRHRGGDRTAGYTLIEVLIAITVLSVGLLGLASLQIAGLQNGLQSYQRTQASILAYDIADRMRANRLLAISGAAYPDGYAVAPDSLPATLSGTSCAPSTTTAAPCSAAQLAAWDVSDWAVNGLRPTLNSGTARIDCVGACGEGALQRVTVMWDEFRTGARDTSCPPASVYDRHVHLACYSIAFLP